MKHFFALFILMAFTPAFAQSPSLPDDLRGMVRAATYHQEGDGKALKGLRIADLPIKDQNLAVLKRYPSVRGLDLQLLPITGKGLNYISQLTGLERLSIYKCFELKDEDFAALTKLKGLRVLSVSATNVGDGGLKQICTLSNLEYLNIGDTRITQTGLAALKKLKKLKVLVTWDPVVRPDFRKELEVALPGIKFGDVSEIPDTIFAP